MPKKTKLNPDAAGNSESDAIFGSPWHLCQTDEEVPVTMIEYSLIRTFGALERWMAECQSGTQRDSYAGSSERSQRTGPIPEP